MNAWARYPYVKFSDISSLIKLLRLKYHERSCFMVCVCTEIKVKNQARSYVFVLYVFLFS